MTSRRLEGRIALITGASRGIGRAVAVCLGSGGAKVVVNYRHHRDAAKETAALVAQAGGEATVAAGDVAEPETGEALVKATMAAFGRLDILVNNAGITRDTLVLRMSLEDWESVQDVNLRGTFLVSKAALRPMLRQRGGRIVNLSSISGRMGNAGQANYAATKAGIIGFTRALAREVASRGITVNAVAPGFILTDIWSDVSEEARQRAIDVIPLGAPGRPEDVAEAVAFFASDAAAYVTGQCLNVDGGMWMS
jgi:3-oxoacyl-[acyl-carrier protein] reductase